MSNCNNLDIGISQGGITPIRYECVEPLRGACATLLICACTTALGGHKARHDRQPVDYPHSSRDAVTLPGDKALAARATRC